MKKFNLKQLIILMLSFALSFSACDDENNDPKLGLNAELSVSVDGDENDETNIEFIVTLSETNNTGSDITFDFNTITTGTATDSEDYVAITGATANLTIADGESTGTITVIIVQDTEKEETETVIGQIANPSINGITILTDQATANIEDDDVYSNGVFITNEGLFGAGNGSVSFYSITDNTLTNNVFNTVNGRVLGDVVQSITVHNNVAYIVVNNSNKVEVAKAGTFEEKGVITDVSGPRYFTAVSDEKGYVSQWGDNGAVKVIDLATLTVTGTITTGTGPERMIIHNNLVYVTNSGGIANNNTVSIIDPSTDQVTKTITLEGDSPRDLIVDANGDIWVLCAGYVDYSNYPNISETSSKLVRINGTTNEVAETITIGESYHPTCLETSNDGNNIFYGGGYGVQGIYKMSITDTSVPTTPLIDKFFYGFNINPETGNIFAMDAPSFTANGTLWRYETSGTVLGSYEAGIGPNGAGFKKK
ncbi:DUF5074 domain-containing protein [Bacteroidota bacterium]